MTRLKNRVVFLGTSIDDIVANLIVAQLLYLKDCPITKATAQADE